MTTSGTTTFNLDFTEAIEESFERAGLESRNGWDLRSARRSINLMFADWANRGLNLWLMDERSQALTYNLGQYTIGTDVIDIVESMIELTTPPSTRYNCSRVSISTFAGRTNPTITGRPTEIYIDRQQPAPIVHLWPLPDATGQYTLVTWVLRRIEDAGAYTNTADLPFRFLPAFIAGLAYMIAEKKRQDDPNLIERLKASYIETWMLAAEEDREKAVLEIKPRGSSYRIGL